MAGTNRRNETCGAIDLAYPEFKSVPRVVHRLRISIGLVAQPVELNIATVGNRFYQARLHFKKHAAAQVPDPADKSAPNSTKTQTRDPRTLERRSTHRANAHALRATLHRLYQPSLHESLAGTICPKLCPFPATARSTIRCQNEINGACEPPSTVQCSNESKTRDLAKPETRTNERKTLQRDTCTVHSESTIRQTTLKTAEEVYSPASKCQR